MKLGFANMVKEGGDKWRSHGYCAITKIFGFDHVLARAVLMSSDAITSDERDFYKMQDILRHGKYSRIDYRA